jgi:hypothetical protein
LYLQAALQADRFPEVTTHYWMDCKDLSGHYDPRCFRLQHFYDLIAEQMGHEKGRRYGIEPKPGLKRGENNVWGDKSHCKEDPNG